MLTRKGLNALAEALAQEFAEMGANPHQAGTRALRVVTALRQVGAVTSNFDGLRFTDAVEKAASRQ